MQTHRHWLQG